MGAAMSMNDELAAFPSLVRVLQARGLERVSHRLSDLVPSSELKDLPQAVIRLDAAIDAGERILVVGDFDCDGATATALCVGALRKMGADVDFVIPNRFLHGYGFTPKFVTQAIASKSPKLILTVDNGISDQEGVLCAQSLGVEVIITDHHMADSAPPCLCINPNQSADTSPLGALVGVGVAFYIMGTLAKQRTKAGKKSLDILAFLDLVALGTMADVGKMDANNRILVAQGLKRIQEGRACLGIKALFDLCKLLPTKATSSDLSYTLAPKINAAGRMGAMEDAVFCLLAHEEKDAYDKARILLAHNYERRALQDAQMQEANQMLDTLKVRRAVVLYRDHWHQGISGIMAAHIKEQTGKSTFVFAPADATTKLIKGSGRGADGVHLKAVLDALDAANPGLLQAYGGHAGACGLSLAKDALPAFCKALETSLDQVPNTPVTKLAHDGALMPFEFSLAFVDALKRIPWGAGFAPPVFCGCFAVLGYRILKEAHLKLSLRHVGVNYPIEAICFNYDVDAWHWRACEVELHFCPQISYYGGEHLVLHIQSLRVISP